MRLIDADEMRENLLWCKSQSSRYDNYWDDVIERLDVQPTIDAAPVVHGEWIGEDGEHVQLTDGITDNSCSCSICGRWLTGSDEYATFGYYCPNCGAKMDLEG